MLRARSDGWTDGDGKTDGRKDERTRTCSAPLTAVELLLFSVDGRPTDHTGGEELCPSGGPDGELDRGPDGGAPDSGLAGAGRY